MDVEPPDEWYTAETQLFVDMLSGDWDAYQDQHLQDLFDTALFDPDATHDERISAYDELIEYLWDEYGVDFEDVFDWEDYREWYDAA